MRIALIFATYITFGVVASQASEPEKISPEQFSALVALPMGTMRYTEFVGVTGGKAYIVLHEMSTLGTKKWVKKIYWTEAKKINPRLLISLKPLKQ